MWLLSKEGDGGEDKAGGAESALSGTVRHEGALHRIEVRATGYALDGGDLSTLGECR